MGGFGTLDELMEILTLVQTQKLRKKMAVVLYGTSFWKEILNFEALVRHGMIAEEDLDLFKFADDVDTAYHSQLLTKDYLIQTGKSRASRSPGTGTVPNSLRTLLDWLGRVGLAFVLLLFLYFGLDLHHPSAAYWLGAGLGALVTAAVWLIVRLLLRGGRYIWRLRNWLLVTYMFIAVVPILLVIRPV